MQYLDTKVIPSRKRWINVISLKLTTSDHQKTSPRVKRQATDREKIITKDSSRIHRELL